MPNTNCVELFVFKLSAIVRAKSFWGTILCYKFLKLFKIFPFVFHVHNCFIDANVVDKNYLILECFNA